MGGVPTEGELDKMHLEATLTVRNDPRPLMSIRITDPDKDEAKMKSEFEVPVLISTDALLHSLHRLHIRKDIQGEYTWHFKYSTPAGRTDVDGKDAHFRIGLGERWRAERATAACG